MRSQEEVEEVLRLIAGGVNDCEIERRTGIPRRTVLDWRHGRASLDRSRRSTPCGGHCIEALPVRAYAYLLGLYLGDGCLSAGRRTWRLRVVLDASYPGVVLECANAMQAILPAKRPYVMHRRDGNCVEVSMWWKHWPCAFPQHGPGRKHQRRIKLEAWQEAILGDNNEPFLRGLIHSDGCRFIARQRKGKSNWAWTRYVFSNRSEDIKDLFCASCDALGVRWTRTARDVAVARRGSVARLDEFIGPKS
jgi:hypothetical protein